MGSTPRIDFEAMVLVLGAAVAGLVSNLWVNYLAVGDGDQGAAHGFDRASALVMAGAVIVPTLLMMALAGLVRTSSADLATVAVGLSGVVGVVAALWAAGVAASQHSGVPLSFVLAGSIGIIPGVVLIRDRQADAGDVVDTDIGVEVGDGGEAPTGAPVAPGPVQPRRPDLHSAASLRRVPRWIFHVATLLMTVVATGTAATIAAAGISEGSLRAEAAGQTSTMGDVGPLLVFMVAAFIIVPTVGLGVVAAIDRSTLGTSAACAAGLAAAVGVVVVALNSATPAHYWDEPVQQGLRTGGFVALIPAAVALLGWVFGWPAQSTAPTTDVGTDS
ncbi:hypothetical protein BH09ACT11_BH09ACT11_17160 [soil metagenome]